MRRGALPDDQLLSPLGCGFFAPCELDAGHDHPHSPGLYPKWQVPTLEPMAFIHPADLHALDDGDQWRRLHFLIDQLAIERQAAAPAAEALRQLLTERAKHPTLGWMFDDALALLDAASPSTPDTGLTAEGLAKALHDDWEGHIDAFSVCATARARDKHWPVYLPQAERIFARLATPDTDPTA